MRQLSFLLFATLILIDIDGMQHSLHSGDVRHDVQKSHVRVQRDEQFQIQGVETVERTVPMRKKSKAAKRRQRSHRPTRGFSIPTQQETAYVEASEAKQRAQFFDLAEGPRAGGFGQARYYYPPRQRLPLRKCFYNPTGYVCCNEILNDLMVETFAEMETRPKFHTCNIQAIANAMQKRTEEKFNTSFEAIVAYDDFAQKVHFSNDLICKVELGGRYMLAYATARNVQERGLPPVGVLAQHGPITEALHKKSRKTTVIV
ncbi:hypothetical protein Q1695_006358 [Nippostrongylus brasiliensis]|nr:hypothetical protein Q1695_006358 [Nippostrongylus brasiliensis]